MMGTRRLRDVDGGSAIYGAAGAYSSVGFLTNCR
jgi:hypothetical protein